KPVPEAVANIAEEIKEIIIKNVPLIPKEAATPAIPSANPEVRRILAKTPAKIQHTTGTIASLLAIPSIIVLAYSFLSLAKKKATTNAVYAGTQRAPSEIEPK